MTEGSLKRKAKAYRTELEKAGPDISKLTDKQKAEIEAAKAQEIEAYNASKNEMINKAKAIDEIMGFKLNNEVRNFLLNEVVPKNPGEDSAFVQSIMKDPSMLLRLRFYEAYGDKMLKAAAKFHYERGLNARPDITAKLPDTQIRSYNIGGKSSSRAEAPVKDLGEMSEEEFAKFLEAGSRV
jgi:hypothetical protein